MGRHNLSDPRIQAVVEGLVDIFLRSGTIRSLVAELQAALSRTGSERRVYPNRIHTLLAGDATRTVSTATLETVEQGLSAIGAPGPSAAADQRREEIRRLLATMPSAPDRVAQVAALAGFPAAVVRTIAGQSPTKVPEANPSTRSTATLPDWSWQTDAVRACLRSLTLTPSRKSGLVVPTAGGKTRIALMVGLQLLAEADGDREILWVTHRRHLRLQARRTLQRLLNDGDGLPSDAVALFADRFHFAMLRDLPEEMAARAEHLHLVIVDEGHHAAAPSYRPLFEAVPSPRALFLTATPNRADGLPIGIDEVAYTVTYGELFRRGCVVEPIFDPPLTMDSLDWASPDGLHDLADYLLDRTEDDLSKVLVVVSRIDRVEVLHEAIAELHDARPDHPLAADDIGFCHGSRSSGGSNPDSFLDAFAARPRGLLVATSQLVGEGFDDPGIDGVVVTYPSNSISHLMQVAGRALRYSPGKETAHVTQVRHSALEYHFEQRWLYQDISDRLRPQLIDLRYDSTISLRQRLEELLIEHRVSGNVQVRVLAEQERIGPGETVRVVLAGLPYYGEVADFDKSAEWQALLTGADGHERFRHIFNLVSDRNVGTHDPVTFLSQFLDVDHRGGSAWKSYHDLILAMEHAQKELDGTPYPGRQSRPPTPGQATTWLRYVTFAYAPAMPRELDDFLLEAENRADIAMSYLDAPQMWALAVRVPLPLYGYEAFLLDDAEAKWLKENRDSIIELLRASPPLDAYSTLAAWRGGLARTGIPLRLLDRVEYLLRVDLYDAHILDLRGLRRCPIDSSSAADVGGTHPQEAQAPAVDRTAT